MPRPERLTSEAFLATLRHVGLPTDLRDAHLLDSALAAPYAAFAGTDLYPNVFDRAAAVMRSIIGNHPFLDGNKRADLFAAVLALTQAGFALDAPDDALFDEVLASARGERSVAEIATFLRMYSTPSERGL